VDQGRQAGGEDDTAELSSIPGQRSALAVELAGVQLGKPVAAAGVAEEDLELVADQFAATADQARPVILAPIGRGPSDAPGIRGDSAADLGAAFTGGLRAGGLPGRNGSEEKKEGRWSVREFRRNSPKSPVDSCREGAPTAFHDISKTFRLCAAKKLLVIEAIAVYYSKPARQKIHGASELGL
jgi:hypothetical protein